MTKVAIVILNFNGYKDTLECLKSIRNLNLTHDLELMTIVVDNGSANDSVKKLKASGEKFHLIENKVNLGFTGGSNTGMRYAIDKRFDYVMLLNNDTIVHEELVKELVESIRPEKVGAVVPKIYFAKGHEFHKDKYKQNELGKVIWYAGGEMDWENLIGKNIGVDEVDKGQFDIKQETELATGCCLLIKTEVLKEVGLFDDKFYLYYEDADLTQRLKKNGYSIIYNPKAVVWHVNAGSGGGSGSSLQDYYITRNRLLLGMKYAPLRTRLALLRESMKILLNGRAWQKKGVLDFFKGRTGKGSFIFKV